MSGPAPQIEPFRISEESKTLINALLKIVFLALLTAANPAFASVVKMSNSGICHPPQSSWYDRTKTFQPFDSVEACLDSGGRLPKGMARPSVSDRRVIKSSDSGSYSRSAFGHGWDDSDGDCQDSRAEALIQMSSTPVRFATDRRCRVVTGRWISPFSGNVIQNASEADIDHVVPLKWAWDRGANHWSDVNRERFANDPVNLLPVEAVLIAVKVQEARWNGCHPLGNVGTWRGFPGLRRNTG